MLCAGMRRSEDSSRNAIAREFARSRGSSRLFCEGVIGVYRRLGTNRMICERNVRWVYLKRSAAARASRPCDGGG